MNIDNYVDFRFVNLVLNSRLDKQLLWNYILKLRFENHRFLNLDCKYDFLVTRAVAKMPFLIEWSKGKFNKNSNNYIPNGIIALKGGNIDEELKNIQQKKMIKNLKIILIKKKKILHFASLLLQAEFFFLFFFLKDGVSSCGNMRSLAVRKIRFLLRF